MDPITIAHIVSNAAAVGQTAWKVYEFINNARNVDSKVRQIQSELKQTSDVCGLVKIKVNLLPPSHHDLLKAIDGQINYCLLPIQEIERKIKPQHKSSNFFSQAFRQVKLEINTDDINRCRSQIQASLANLQLTLQLVNVQATYLAPQRADEVLLEMLENIQKTLDKEGNKIGSDVRHCAGQYISSGSTLYSESVRGTSVLGLQDKSKPSAVRGWLDQLESMRIDEVEAGSFTDASLASVSEHPTSTAVTSLPADGYESEDSLEIEVASHALVLGKEAFVAKEFDKAESLLSEFLECIKILPEHKRRMHDLEEVHLLLAICAFHLHDAMSAESALTTAIGTETRFTKNAEIKCDAVQCLSIVYLRTGRLNQAISTCEGLYKGQKRLFGKDERYYKTLALLGRVHAARGNAARASAYRSMIPAEFREQLLKDVEAISLEQVPNLEVPPGSPSNESARNLEPTASSSRPSTQSARSPESAISAELSTSLEKREEHYSDNPVSISSIPKPPRHSGDRHNPSKLLFGNGTLQRSYFNRVAWSYDNELIALGQTHIRDIKIDLHDTVRGALLYSFEFDGLGAVDCIAFNSSATKLAAGFSRLLRTKQQEYDLHLCVWSVSLKQLLWNVKLISCVRSPHVVVLSFNPVNDDQLLVQYDAKSRERIVTVYDIVHRKPVYFEQLPILTHGVFWSNEGPGLWGIGGIVNLDIAMQTMKLGSIEEIVCATISTYNDLVVMNKQGKINHYMNKSGNVLPREPCPAKAINGIRTGQMTLDKHQATLLLVWTETGSVNLVAPQQHSWIELASGLESNPQIGFSPDGRYAYYVTDGVNSGGVLHAVLVEEFLGIQR